ncbi:hypothetical protein EZY14_009100 [Kordia sp. TARA_039_SRF]|nr:hypothetical protein EZY14_009100 [Kordia sp. TARA_039_SRF]
MKTKFLKNKKDVDGKSTLIDIGTITMGAGIAKGVEGLLQVKDTTMLNGGYLVVGGLGSAFIDDKSDIGKAVKGLLVGVAVKGAFDLISEFISPKIENNGSKTNKFIADMWSQVPVTSTTTTTTSRIGSGMNGRRPRMAGSPYKFVPRNLPARPTANESQISLQVA